MVLSQFLTADNKPIIVHHVVIFQDQRVKFGPDGMEIIEYKKKNNGIPWNAFAKPKILMEVDILDEDALNTEVPQGSPGMPDGTQTEAAEMITLDMDEVKSLISTEPATPTTSAEYFIMSKDGTKTAAGGPRGYRPVHHFKPPYATAAAGGSSNIVPTASGTACSATAINSPLNNSVIGKY